MKKRYKILSILLALVIAIGSVVTISIFSSSAESFTDENGISWTVTENYPGWAIKPTNKTQMVGDITIPSKYGDKLITAIPNNAFINCTELTGINIPDSVSYVGSAFCGCTNLANVQLGSGVQTIYSSFTGCTSLTNITIPDSVKYLGSFSDCTALESIKIPSSVTYLGGFRNCTSLTGELIIPDSVTKIGNEAFRNCTNISSVVISNNMTELSSYSFGGCTNLTSINLGNNLKTISDYAFNGCTGLTSVTIPDSVTEINAYAFHKCTGLTSLDLGNGVKTIGNGAFRNCTGLTGELVIPDSVTEIGEEAFSGCSGLTSLDLGDSVTTIGKQAFNGCYGLTGELVIPNSVKVIKTEAFMGCSKLTSVIIPDNIVLEKTAFNASLNLGCNSTTTKFTDDSGLIWNLIKYSNVVEITPADKTQMVGDITIPSEYEGAKITSIGNRGFYNCTNLTSITIPNSVTKIDTNAFYGCTGLASITIPDSVTTIDNNAFNGCTGLTSLNLGNGVKTIGDEAFKKCTGLIGELIIPDSVTEIGKNAFNGCINLTSINLGNNLKTISDYAFYSCTGLTSVTIPDSVTEIGAFAFYKCTGLTGELVIPDSVTKIRESAFSGCTGLTSLDLSNNIEYLSGFVGCTGLTSVEIPNTVTEIGKQAFDNCTGLTSVIIPDSVSIIGDHAFYSCTGLTSLDLGNGVKTVDSYAFGSCDSLSNVEIPDSVTSIGDHAFVWSRNAFDNIVIGKNIEYIGDYAFAYLGELGTLTIENKKTSDISTIAFIGDTFNDVVVTDTVEEIDSVILSGNKNFEIVTLGSNITSITDNAFFGNTNMSITAPENAETVITYAQTNNIPITITSAVDATRNVDFEVTCDKSGYEFTVYRVADLESGVNPYEIRYDSLITDIEDEIFEGDSDALLTELDKIDSSLLTEVVGTYSTDVDGSSKLFEDLPAGIYYVRATDFPANVYSVQNSVFALPYYVEDSNWWTYELSPIPLATKVDESNPDIAKTITNSTKDNVNFTDVSLGDTVNFEIEASRVGSANVVESKDFKLNSYVVSDIMESGLTLNQNSFVVTLEDIDGNTLATLEDTTDYIVNIVASEGVDTTFTVSLTPEYLQEDEFYSSANVVIAYSAVLNEYSTREFDGNYNTATNLTYTNKTNVSATVDGNTVYAYTFGIEVNKYDDAGTPLAGSQFALYLTEDDAKAMKNEIATGTSTDTGKVEFFTSDNDVIKLQSGTYYIVETKATENYNRYTDVIPVTITVEYGETEVNGTYIESAPENGIQLVEVKNSKVVIPNTGGDGAMYRYVIALAFAMLAVTLVVLKKRSSKKATVTK